jgi:hypothetical protein
VVVHLVELFHSQRREHLGATMKTVVLVSGQMRTADQCATGIRELYPDATFIVHAVADADDDKAFAFKPGVTVIEPQHEMPERREYSWQMGRGCHGVQRVLKQLWGLARVWEVFQASGIEADVVVRMRPDLVFDVPPEAAAGGGVHIPRFANWWGYNDRFAFGDLPTMRAYFTRLNRLDEYIDAGGIFHPETFLRSSLAGCVVQRTRAVFATLRADGSRDEPLWIPEAGDLP